MAVNTAGQTLAQYNESVSNVAIGTITFDATSITTTDYAQIDTGFEPRYICIDNVTDRIKLEWYKGMATDRWVKTVAAGTRTLDTTSSALIVTGKYVRVLQDATLGVIAASKVVAFKIIG
jgi:hypothetical protein